MIWRSSDLLTGQSWELLLVVVELVDRIDNARSNASSRSRATIATGSRQPRKSSLTVVPRTVLKRECVQFQHLGRSEPVCVYAKLYTIQGAIHETMRYLILSKSSACL